MASTLIPFFAAADATRRMQGAWLDALGFGPEEATHEVIASGPLWRLRRYRSADSGPVVLLVPAPIKNPYIWDLLPSVSAARRCREAGFRVYLLEWRAPEAGKEAGGLADYADEAISGAVDVLTETVGAVKPVMIGHSLGGTLAAIQGGLYPDRFAGLVLLSAPLCFQPGTSRFGDALADVATLWLSDIDVLPGSLITQLSAAASPSTFLWSRLADAVATSGDGQAMEIRMRIERWALDEVPLSAKLTRETLSWLFGENRLCRGKLEIGGKRIEPARLGLPILAVANTSDDVAPPESVRPFLETMPGADRRLIDYPGEAGIVLQHLGVLAGRKAFASLWPEIIAWIDERHRCVV